VTIKLKTLAQAWASHEAAITNAGATPLDCHRARLSFYAGAAVAIETVRAMGGDDIGEDEAVEHLSTLWDEVHAVAGDALGEALKAES
jgi:hypothetical protein